MAGIHVPARNVAGDQVLAATDNGSSEWEQHIRILNSLPAGNNNIGDVDVASLPALPAGNNNIGDVDVASLPSLPAGTNDIGNVYLSGTDPIAATTGTITTSTGTVTTSDVNAAGTVLVMVYGTYAGINLTFEGLSSAGGNTNWVPVAGARIDGSKLESVTGVLPANTTTAWRFPVARLNQFRVRATAYTSGTMNVIVDPAVPFGEPVVNAIMNSPPTRVERSFVTGAAGGTTPGAITGVTTEALTNLISNTGGTASNATTTFSPASGKAMYLKNLSLQVISGAAAIHFSRVFIRAVSSGTVTASSPVLAMLTAYTPVATSGVSGSAVIPLDIVIPPGWSFGLSHIETATTTTFWASISGYEY